MSKPNPSAVVSTMIAIPLFVVFPAKAGNQPYYVGQSPLNEELDTRLREYDSSINDDSIRGEAA